MHTPLTHTPATPPHTHTRAHTHTHHTHTRAHTLHTHYTHTRTHTHAHTHTHTHTHHCMYSPQVERFMFEGCEIRLKPSCSSHLGSQMPRFLPTRLSPHSNSPLSSSAQRYAIKQQQCENFLETRNSSLPYGKRVVGSTVIFETQAHWNLHL